MHSWVGSLERWSHCSQHLAPTEASASQGLFLPSPKAVSPSAILNYVKKGCNLKYLISLRVAKTSAPSCSREFAQWESLCQTPEKHQAPTQAGGAALQPTPVSDHRQCQSPFPHCHQPEVSWQLSSTTFIKRPLCLALSGTGKQRNGSALKTAKVLQSHKAHRQQPWLTSDSPDNLMGTDKLGMVQVLVLHLSYEWSTHRHVSSI